MEVILLMGLQASGKSTFYKRYFSDSHLRLNLDMLHTRNKEKQLLSTCLEISQSVVIDNTNPTKLDRQRYFQLAGRADVTFIGYYFQSKLAECLKRNQQRTGQAHLPEIALKATAAKLELPDFDEGFSQLYYVAQTADQGFDIKEWANEI
ncbi:MULTISPECIES: ATP-binding protein [unclassified Enterococcus]|uniref:ATP-binding protein n=1 Tax=unclassified Enterococcus TaxID=2608891 RepID=UPI001CE07A50|nr:MULTISPECIES: ATP-binding protein [unclassified Enterococcus]MCA5013709.1 ATP-binding protein [Enterococcus sp. S23]MCA5016959.1 ATP-binding protein [Enterococcus sp. S22(2020)]